VPTERRWVWDYEVRGVRRPPIQYQPSTLAYLKCTSVSVLAYSILLNAPEIGVNSPRVQLHGMNP